MRVVNNKLFSPSGPPTASQCDIVDNRRQSHNYIATTPLLPLRFSESLSVQVIIPGGYINSSLSTIQKSVLRLKFQGLGVYFVI